MNFYASRADDDRGSGVSLIHSDSHHANAIVVPDAELLFTGHLHRAGLDLVLTGHDGRHHVIPGYFANEHPPALAAPNGAYLSPDIVDLLAESSAPHEYAQAQSGLQSAVPADSIGKVQKVAGSATVLRNGVSVALNVGDVVYKSDVIVTGADSKVGLTFPDGTALELLPNTRMALNEYSYDSSSTSNQALFTLVQGTFGFVAGKVAHTGDMKIGTPVATMGIRGTTGVVQQVGTFNAGNVTYSYSVYDDPGTTNSGSWDMWVVNPDGSSTLIATVSQTGYVTFVTPQGVGLPPLVTTVPLTDSQVAADQLIIQDLFDVWGLGGPHSIGIPGSGDNPLFQAPPDFLPEINSPAGSNNGNNQLPGLPSLPGPQDPGNPVFASNIFIWPVGNSTWPSGGNWNQGFAPNGPQDIVIIESGIVTYNLPFFQIDSLTIDGPGQNGGLPQGGLDMIGGELVVTNGLTVFGEFLLDGDPPVFVSYGPSTIESGGEIIVNGSGSAAEFSPDLSRPITTLAIEQNFGAIIAEAGGLVEFIYATVTNEAANAGNTNPNVTTPAGRMESTGKNSILDFTDTIFINAGSVLATDSGEVAFGTVDVGNAAGASITADHRGTITFAPSSAPNPLGVANELVNAGRVAAESGGQINILDVPVANEAGGLIGSFGRDSAVSFTGSALGNAGVLRAGRNGTIDFSGETIFNESGGKILARTGGHIDIQGGTLADEAGAIVKAADHGSIFFDGSGSSLSVTNDGQITATDFGIVAFDDVGLANDTTINARNHGVVTFVETRKAAAQIVNTGTISTEDHGIVAFIDVGGDKNEAVANAGGTIQADGCGSEIVLAQSAIDGGTLQTRHGGKIEAVYGDNTFLNVTLNGALVQIDCSATLALSGLTTIDKTVVLEGPGVVTMGASDEIIGVEGTKQGEDGSKSIPATLENSSTIDGAGNIGGGENSLKLINEAKGQIIADGSDGTPLVINTGTNRITNDGLLEAACLGALDIESKLDNFGRVLALGGADVVASADVTNEAGGRIVADGGDVTLDGARVVNDAGNCETPGGLIEAKGLDSLVTITVSTLDNGGTIRATGEGATVAITVQHLDNTGGTIAAKMDGVVDITDTIIHNGSTGQIVSTGTGSDIVFTDSKVVDGDISVTGKASLDFEGTSDTLDGVVDVTVGPHGTIFVGETTDGGTTLDLTHGTKIEGGGTLIIENGSTLQIESSGGATLDDINVVNDGTINVDGDDDASTVPLLIEDGTAIGGGTLDVGHEGLIEIESSSGAAFDGVSAHIARNGNIEIGEFTSSGSILMLDDGAEISGHGTLTIHAQSILDVESGSGAGANHGATLDGITVADSGQIEIGDKASGAILTLDDGATITGSGTMTIATDSEVDVTDGPGATLEGVDVLDSGLVQVERGATLDLEGVAIAGGTLNTVGSPYSGGGVIEVLPDGISTFDGATAAVTVEGDVQVAAGAHLELTGAIDIDANNSTTFGIIDLYDSGELGGILDISGTVALGGTDGEIVLGGGDTSIVAAANGAVLDNGIYIYGGGDIGHAGDHALTFNNSGYVIADDGTAAPILIDTGNDITNSGTLKADGGVLQIDDNVIDNNMIAGADGGTVILNGISVSGGEISIDDASTLKIENGATILSNVDVENAGNLVIDSGSTLAWLEVDTGTTIHGGTITVDGAGELDVDGGTLGGVTIDDSGVVNFDGPVTLDGDLTINLLNNGSFTDAAPITIAAGDSVTLSGVCVGTVDIGSNATFALSDADAKTVDFVGTDGTLKIDSASDIPGTITDFVKGDAIDLANLGFSTTETASWDSSTNTLTISNGTQSESLHLAGTYSQNEFALQKDGSGTDLVIIDPVLTGAQSETVAEGNSVSTLGVTDSATDSDVTITGLPGDLANFDGGTYTAADGTWTGTQAEFNALSFTAGTAGTYQLLIVESTSGAQPETSSETFTLTVDPLVPEIAPQTEAQTIAFNTATSITGLGVSETDSVPGETFTVTLADTTGLLSTTGTEGTITNDGSNDLIISGTLNQVNDDLGLLTDTNATAGADNITVNATDGFGNAASAQVYDITVASPEPPVITSANALAVVTEDASYHGNLILNGGFEQYGYNSQTGYTIPDWTFGGHFYYPPGEASPPHSGYGALAVYTYTLGTGTASQSFATDIGQDYEVTFYLYKAEGAANSFSAIWDGTTEVSLQNYTNFGSYVEYQFNAVATESASTLQFDFDTGAVGYWFLDDVSVTPVGTPGNEVRTGTISFTDPNASDTHTVSETPQGSGYLGTFTANVTHDSTGGGTGDVSWSFTVSDAALASLAPGQVVDQVYDVSINGSDGVDVVQPVTVQLVGIQVPTSFVFTPDTANLSELEDVSKLNSGGGGSIGSFTQSGGPAGDNYTFSIGGSGLANFSPDGLVPNIEYLYTNDTHTVPGGNPADVYALTVTITDTTTGAQTGALPFDVVVGNSGNNAITLTGTGSLGISATTPTIVYGLDGNDTINATGMTAPVWLVGGSGADIMTGGTGINSYLYGSTSESNASKSNSVDTITNFHTTSATGGDNDGNNDIIDLSGLTFAGSVSVGTSTISSGKINADSIGWIQNGTETDVYIDTTSRSENLTSASMEIVLQNFTASWLSANNFSYAGHVVPAGAAGAPIDLALTDPATGQGSDVTVTISDVPTGWVLNGGKQNADGTWTVQTGDPSSLTVTTPVAFAGAALLNVIETWTNPDGSTGAAYVSDNVEAYAVGAPIFALAGDDNLTGAGGNDTFVFAQPIGNDTIYNFNAASDKIDLIGFSGVNGFGDLHIADNAGGDAVITLADGETITLHGVDASALSPNDFAFNVTPVTENSGVMTVSDGAELPLSGTIDNTGTIAIVSVDSQTELQLTGNGITLEGGGHVALSGDAVIAGTTPSTVLDDIDNTISGAGQIGTGDGNLTLVNDVHGTIEANISGADLTIDTGHTVTNQGVLEAANGATLHVEDAVTGTGVAVIADGTIAFDASSSANVTFDNSGGYGELALGNAASFTGSIAGFTGTDATHSDVVDLGGIDFNSANFAETYHAATGVLSVTDGTNSANITFDNFQGALDFASDGHGGTTITDAPTDAAADPLNTAAADGALSFADNDAASDLSTNVTPEGQNYVGSLTTGTVTESHGTASVDYGFSLGNDQIGVANGQTVTQSYQVSLTDAHNPAENSTQTAAVTIGGAGNDNFVFAPGVGADTVLNFNAQQDTIELDHFANVQTVQELQALITQDAHGDAVINLGNHDSITLANTTTAQLQQAIQNGHILLH